MRYVSIVFYTFTLKIGYNALLISTIVDKFMPYNPKSLGYNALLISTIVDRFIRLHSSVKAIMPF